VSARRRVEIRGDGALRFWNVAGRRYARFARLGGSAGLVHAFSTRPQDVSARDDARAPERDQARRRMARDLGLDSARLRYCVQVHEARCALVDSGAAPGAFEGFDSIITAEPGAPLMTFSADCPLVLIYDPATPALGLAHASWRCTVAAVTAGLVAAMIRQFGSRPADLLAGIGPGAGPCCYEVGADVYEAAARLEDRELMFARRDGCRFFDLWEANRLQLIRSGLAPESIETAGVCTMCRNDVFYSFRRERAGCGHFGLMAALACPSRSA
jgi:hypothetical protein